MKLTYRGVRYTEENLQLLTPVENPEITYRGNSLKVRINPSPWLKYITQLFNRAESKSVYDPITFWYDHKRKFLEYCRSVDDVERLNEALKQKPKTKLKYCGVTYYR